MCFIWSTAVRRSGLYKEGTMKLTIMDLNGLTFDVEVDTTLTVRRA
jgi:hypothetical protein